VAGDKAHQRLKSELIGCGLEDLTVRTRLAGPNVREEASATSFGEIVALSTDTVDCRCRMRLPKGK
jgi:hypothetical protein